LLVIAAVVIIHNDIGNIISSTTATTTTFTKLWPPITSTSVHEDDTDRIMMIDLSYRPYMEVSTMNDLIQNILLQRQRHDIEHDLSSRRKLVDRLHKLSLLSYDLDVSHSQLGDEGFSRIINRLFEHATNTTKLILDDRKLNVSHDAETTMQRNPQQQGEENKIAAKLDNMKQQAHGEYDQKLSAMMEATMSQGIIPFTLLSALRIRMNNLTPKSVLHLLQKITTGLYSNNVDGDTHSNPMRLSTLDLSFNNLDSSENNKINDRICQQWEIILSNPRICPINIVLENCRITPNLCRAIAKGFCDRYEKAVLGVKNNRHRQPTPMVSDRKDGKDNNNNNNDHNINDVYDAQSKAVTLSLYLSGNKNIGNVGIVAIAAAIRSISILLYDHSVNHDDTKVAEKKENGIELENEQEQERDDDEHRDHPRRIAPAILDVLDLSSCHIGDIGLQAMAMAFEEFFLLSDDIGCPIRELILSHNDITDQGVMSLGKILMQQRTGVSNTVVGSPSFRTKSSSFSLDLSGNLEVTDRSISALFGGGMSSSPSSFLENGWTVLLRSCSIGADGTETLGRGLRQYLATLSSSMALRNDKSTHVPHCTRIDLSGNPLGTLRGKKNQKHNKSTSSSSFTKKATATAASYMNTGMSFLKKAGITFPSTIESDDEEEEERAQDESKYDDSDDYDPSRGRCALKALSNSFTNIMSNNEANYHDDGLRRWQETASESPSLKSATCTVIIKIGLRHTFCDMAGADALAYMITYAKEVYPFVQFEIDLDLNLILEDDMIKALFDPASSSSNGILREMSQRHYHAMQTLRETRKRTIEANRIAKARYEAQTVLDGLSMKDSNNDSSGKKSNSPYTSRSYNDVNDEDDDYFYDDDENYDDDDEI
jgi:Leucine Rich repeat